MFMKVRVRWILLVFSSLLCVLCLGRSRSRAGTFSVDVSVDEVDVAPGGSCAWNIQRFVYLAPRGSGK